MKLLSVIVLLFLCAGIYAGSAIGTLDGGRKSDGTLEGFGQKKKTRRVNYALRYFCDIPWGSSAADVKSKWKAPLEPDQEGNLSSSCKLGSDDASIFFRFYDNRLYKVSYFLILENEPNNMKHVEKFRYWQTALTKKYGAPDAERWIHSLGDTAGLNASNLGDYLYLGYVGLNSVWTSNYSRLAIRCNSTKSDGPGRTVVIIIDYKTVDQKLLSAAEAKQDPANNAAL